MDRRAVERLQSVNDFDSLLIYLRDELDWPVEDYGFDDLTFQYTAQELGLDDQSAAKVTAIRRLRPLDDEQPWGIFFLELEPKRLPVVALRRVLSKMTLKKRASSNRSDSPAWHADDILFISRTGESDERHLTFAHFAANPEKADLPVLKVLGWDASDTVLRIDHVAELLKEKLVWPEDPSDSDQWRKQWRDAFTLKHREQVTTAKEMASRLAELARSIRGAIREVLAVESENGPLTKIMDAFRESLVHDLDPEQFADTYAQTITYGLLSARITDPRKNTLDDLASHMQTNPFLKELMESFIHVGGRKKNDSGAGLDFDELGVSDVIELLDNANMEAVVRDFGKQNQQEDPVIHFFEGFLQEYDKSIRKDRGVFYTPWPVVSFIVRSVDELLRTEFGLEDGLADTTTWGEMAGRIDDLEIPEGATPDQAFVQILDPATGTGTFLVEVIDLIHNTMTAKWQVEGHSNKKVAALWNAYVPEHLLPRLHGYELMMAPYAIAHMKIGLKLYETGYRFESPERARVYLTNALELAQDFSGTLAFAIPALAHEAEEVNAIKRDQRFTVVIGNPPYSAFSSNPSTTEDGRLTFIGGLIEDYKVIDGEPVREKKWWLQDDYVKFIRFTQWVVSRAGIGIFGLITNHSYLDNPTFRGMRWQLLDALGQLFVLNLHGNAKTAGKGEAELRDQNVFDIQQGVSILVGVSSLQRRSLGHTRYADLLGPREGKYAYLANQNLAGIEWDELSPSPENFMLVPQDLSLEMEYKRFQPLNDIFRVKSVGIVTARDALTISIESDELWERIQKFVSLSAEGARKAFSLRKDVRDWKVEMAQRDIALSGPMKTKIVPVSYRPLDTRFTYYTGQSRGFIGQPQRGVMRHLIGTGNVALVTTRQQSVSGPWTLTWVSKFIVESSFISNRTAEINYVFPLNLVLTEDTADDLLESQGDSSNLSGTFLGVFSTILDSKEDLRPKDVFRYLYALLHSPSFRARYAEFLKIDFPRLPLTRSLELFQTLALVGSDLVDLHLMDSPKLNSSITELVGAGDFLVEEVSYSDETVWIDKAKTHGFRGVPQDVWNFQIGCYQVCEKWLKDRQAKGGTKPRPGRVLTDEDIEHYQKIVVALSETIRLMAEIDEVIDAHGGWPGAFQAGDAGDKPVSDVVYAKADDDTTQLDMVAEPKDG